MKENKHIFKPHQKVLVRDSKNDEWRTDYFVFCFIEDFGVIYDCDYGNWMYCIPYEGNESLLGTTKNENKEE